MYLGCSLVLLGIAIGFAIDWILLLLILSLPLMHYGLCHLRNATWSAGLARNTGVIREACDGIGCDCEIDTNHIWRKRRSMLEATSFDVLGVRALTPKSTPTFTKVNDRWPCIEPQ
jgi:hypothetical protein